MAETPQIPPSPRIWAHIRERCWSVMIDERQLFVNPLVLQCRAQTILVPMTVHGLNFVIGGRGGVLDSSILSIPLLLFSASLDLAWSQRSNGKRQAGFVPNSLFHYPYFPISPGLGGESATG
jgi:hypothetical protein